MILPFSWYGGKASHLRFILHYLPKRYETYVEPFGGSGAVLLNRRRSKLEVYNDLYGDLVNFFRILRDQPEKLIEQIELTPYSREEFAQALVVDLKANPVERARLFFVCTAQCHGSIKGQASAIGEWVPSAKPLTLWQTRAPRLQRVAKRLSGVAIENRDALYILQRYDSPGTVHYCDPPYALATRPGPAYVHEYNDKQYKEFATCAHELKGMMVLSGYDCPLLRKLFKGWKQMLDTKRGLAGSARPGQKRRPARESLWLNPAAAKAVTLL